MIKHINFFGYSLWISDETQQEFDEEVSSRKALYSPGVLAAYCIFTNLFVAIILYGINIFRRGYLGRGRVLIAWSGLLLVASVFVPILNQLSTVRSGFLLNILVALSLYRVEKPHFQRAIRNGSKQARWWLPLIWIGVIFGTLLWLQMLFV